MIDFLSYYNFLTLALLFAFTSFVVWLLRRDLRPIVVTVAACALPFAFTEFLFYPSYWEPNFLFDLGKRIGFGIEDFIFVCGLAAFSTTAYAFVFNRGYKTAANTKKLFCFLCALGLFIFTGLFFLGLIIIDVAVIYAACLVMIACACVILTLRRDLTIPSVIGACLSTIIYFALCLVAEKIIPGFFENVWHTEHFSNIFIAGVPLEELLYGFSTGLVATAFYPYVFSQKFTKRTP